MAIRTPLVQLAGKLQQLQAGDNLPAIQSISAGTTRATSGEVVFSNSNGVSFGLNGQTLTASVVAGAGGGVALSAGTQLGTSGTIVFSNSNGVSFGLSNSSILTASVDGIKSISGGTTRLTNGEAVFSNSNNVSFGVSGNTITATASYSQSTAPSAISAGAALASSGTIVFSNSNGISFGLNGQTLTAQMPSVRLFRPHEQLNLNAAVTASGTSNLSFQRISVPMQISATRLDVVGNLTVVGSTAGSYTLLAALYTFAASTMSSASSTSIGVTWNSGTNSTAASIYGGQSGTRYRSIALGTWNVTPGEYMLGLMLSQAGVAGTTGSWSIAGKSALSLNQDPGGGVGTAFFADGIFSAGTAAFPASVHLSAINQTGASANAQPFVRMAGTF